MENKCLILMMISWVLVGLCEGQGGGGGGMGDEPPCMKNLLPCTLYLHSNTAPQPLCCVPFKQLMADDLNCLCNVFINPIIMVSLNVTQADASNLAKRCGSKGDSDICKNAGTSAPTGSQSPPDSGGHTNSTDNGSAKSAAVSLSKFGASSSILIILYFVLLPTL